MYNINYFLDFRHSLEYDKGTVVIWSVVMQEIGQNRNEEETDEALVKAFQAGNTEVFPALVARYLKLIRRKACSFREIFSLEREDL